MKFALTSSYQPTGDQPQAIQELVEGYRKKKQFQTLLGVTGSGKTFTMANVIQQLNVPTLVIAHNKTLAGQLYQEFRDFFPHNAVSYFVSYYDYYQPEAYIPSSDTYIEKESTINDEIDKLRLASTTNLLTREDCIVVASVSCIYNLGSPVEYGKYVLEIIEGEVIARETLLLQLANLQYERAETDLFRGTYRLRGDTIQLWPAYQDTALRIETLENKIVSIDQIDPITGSVTKPPIQSSSSLQPTSNNSSQTLPPLAQLQSATEKPKRFVIYPAKHYMTNPKTAGHAIKEIERDLEIRLKELRSVGKIVEAYRLEQKVNYDLDMIRELGFVNGIENYSRYFDGREPGQPPFTLIDYFHENARMFSKSGFLTIVDESHMSIPQIGGMHNGDRSRKQTLIDYGFRLPSARDNRPLTFTEFLHRMNKMMFVSATPAQWEVSQSGNEVVEQLIRPTGLVDPTIDLRPTAGQIEDLIVEIMARKKKGQRTLVTTLTKKMAEALTEYLNDRQKIDTLIAKWEEGERAERGIDQEQSRWGENKKIAQNVVQKNEYPDPNRPIQVGVDIPVDHMPIGPIDPQYYTHAKGNNQDRQIADHEYPKVAYLHSDIETFERSDILDDLRKGVYDVVVGINLLREGLDLPEVTLVAILDADKEGFLRSATSLVQTIGRAARHEEGHVILYADRMTGSMQKAIGETQRRRATQLAYNAQHSITPTTIYKPIRPRMITQTDQEKKRQNMREFGTRFGARSSKEEQMIITLDGGEELNIATLNPESFTPSDRKKVHAKLRRKMKEAAQDMDFELAALLRDAAIKMEG